ncbi:hypothetical protein BBO99_00006405 [Phytophthora kernoviae]|uniref:Uncharacterized protein n=2 Tax=Phytophthora kernoviae TaxID=325452 RepID=A0A421F062_9STRA|nr:hypothetical protein G195_008431 [Phytophthora kernoviae 00238/432]KAG2519702.1 hypothetical protein JM16_007039 [Phytophthora kernoviae]KAG2520671.1 hypothetical protein JM18_007000 [Phytophthora kernoviae]RLN13956.1 hypothetical protein BBI17_006403 [Phytophthora kernoviae]RLN77857.1 hypothetical protein BBO99_00006405 [Phytophthora kernoviae]
MSTDEMAQLRSVLDASDKETQTFLQPLLPLRGVQELLLTFVRDTSRRFEDWVWDPRVRQTLLHMRDAEPQAHTQGSNVDQWYTRAANERLAAMTLENPNYETSTEYLEEADAAQQDGKIKFQKKNFYAACNAFQKSIEAVLKHQQSEYYGKIIPAAEWDDLDLRDRYVTLCNNVAICGIKLKDLSLINEYATKALTVEESSNKALYAMAKLRLLEHRYTEAYEVVDRALEFYPENKQFLHFREEINLAKSKEAKQQAELAAIRAEQVRAAVTAAVKDTTGESTMTAEERELKLRKEILKKAESIPLPTREDDTFAAARLNVYFVRIKQRMLVDIRPIYNNEMGEDPLFECTVMNGTTDDILAAGVRAGSKKHVKNAACKVAIEKLWQDKQATGKLLAEDLAYLEKFKHAQATGQPLTATTPTIAVANAISKKKARAQAAKQVLAAAFEKNLLVVWDGKQDQGDKEAKEEHPSEQVPAHGG